jgi:hypothetical protein
MATLTETAYYTRRAINWFILVIIGYFVLRIVWSIATFAWIAFFPPKPVPPNHAFGRLPALVFPTQASPSGELTFRLETIEGSLPAASNSAVVYFMPKSPANLLALSRTQEFAERLGFNPTPIPETKSIYRFNDTEVPRRLRYDIVSNNFIVRYSFEEDSALFTERNLPSADAAKNEVKSILQTYKLAVDDIAQGDMIVSFLRLSGNVLVPTTSLSQSDSVRVDIFRRAITGIPVLTPYANEAPVSFIFSGSRSSKKRMLQFAYTYWPIDYETLATYTLKPSTQAWEELQAGKGYLLMYPANSTTITVRSVRLAYYDSFEPQNYLQPVFVFEGDEGFMGYVAAIASEWTE